MAAGIVLVCLGDVFDDFWSCFGVSWRGVRWLLGSFWFVLGTFSMTSGAVLGCLGGGVRWLLGSFWFVLGTFSMTSGAVLGCLGEVFDGCWDRFGLSWGRFR